MATFTVTLPSNVEVLNGKQITFRAPADCNGITGIVINGETYDLVDAKNKSVANVNSYVDGAMLSVILDIENKRAYLQNGVTLFETFYVPTLLTAQAWANSQYSFEEMYPFSSYDIDIYMSEDITKTQMKALGAAYICGSLTSNVITAKGDVPNIDIPIILKVCKK